MKLCAACRRHVREEYCPFCGGKELLGTTERGDVSGLTRARIFAGAAAVGAATALSACTPNDPAAPVAVDAGTVGDAVQPVGQAPAYGGPPGEITQPTVVDAAADHSQPKPSPTTSATTTARSLPTYDMHSSPAAAYGAPPSMRSDAPVPQKKKTP